MATIASIQQLSNTNISVQTPGDKIQAGEHRAVNDAIINEIKERGILDLVTITELATTETTDTNKVFIPEHGFFYKKQIAANFIDNISIFASATTGWCWVKLDKFSSTANASGQLEIYLLVGKVLEYFVPQITSGTYNIYIGTTTGGNEIGEVNTNNNQPISIMRYASTNEIIYLTNLPANCNVKYKIS